MAVVRRTISLKPDLDAHLRSLAESREESYSAVVSDLLEEALGLRREPRDLPYFGILKDVDPDLDVRVEEILYGKPPHWPVTS